MRVYCSVECRRQRESDRCVLCWSHINNQFICLQTNRALSKSGYEHLFHATYWIKDMIPYSRLLQSTAV